MMDRDDVELPPVPSTARNVPAMRPVFTRLNSRKRSARSDDFADDEALSVSLHTSSDPALFSSDETPDADNYANGKRRKKKTYAGTWWGERLDRPSTLSRASSSSSSSFRKRAKRKFTRNFDSGIFMNSDDGSSGAEFSSDSSFGNDLLEAQRVVTPDEGPRTPVKATQNTSRTASPKTPRTIRKITPGKSSNQVVVDVLRACLEASREDVDLSSLGLTELPVEVRQLATMIKEDPATGIEFDSLVAHPRLYLANNLFNTFPRPVLDVGNLRLLSLRQNKLTRIPPGIRYLTKLEVLNISGNRLTRLPVELLQLMQKHRLRELLCRPNPFEEAMDTDKLSTDSQLSERNLFANATDRQRSGLKLVATSRAATAVVTHPSRVATLSEVVLRQLARLNNSKKDLSNLMTNGTPKSVKLMLQDLHDAQQEGDRQCASCQRLYIRPALTWVEWWSLPEDEVLQSLKDQAVLPQPIPFDISVCGQCEER